MSSPEPADKSGEQKGLFSRLVDLLFTSSDTDREKKRMLKNIEKEIRASKTHFYNHRNGTVEPQLARFFHALYRTLGPAQTLLEGASSSDALKAIIIEGHLPEEYVDIKNGLTEEEIRRRTSAGDTKTVTAQVKDELRQFTSAFSAELIKTTNNQIAQMIAFLDLISFDYYVLLRRFDSRFPEGILSYTPSFESINAEYVLDDLRDFLEILPSIDPRAEWDILLDRLKEYRRSDALAREDWKKALRAIRSVQGSKVLLNIIRLVEKNPFEKVVRRSYRAKCVEDYLQKIKVQAELSLQKCERQKRTSKVRSYLMKVFGTVSISRLGKYTEKHNAVFAKRMLSGFTHVDSLNYVQAYYQDYLTSETKEVVDLLNVKGKWVSGTSSRHLSDTFRALLQLSEEVSEFDASLGEEEKQGSRLKATLAKAERDRAAFGQLRQLVRAINDTAGALVTTSAQHLIALGKDVKTGLDDFGKPEPTLLANWRDLDMATEGQLKQRLITTYTRIYYLVQLLQLKRSAPG